MNVSFPKCNQAGTEFVISTTDDLQEKVNYLSEDFPVAIFTQTYHHAASDSTPFHWHNELQLNWVSEGELEYCINGDSLRLSGDHGRDRPSGYHHRRKTGRSEKSRRHTGLRESSDHGGPRSRRHRPPPHGGRHPPRDGAGARRGLPARQHGPHRGPTRGHARGLCKESRRGHLDGRGQHHGAHAVSQKGQPHHARRQPHPRRGRGRANAGLCRPHAA